MLPGLLFVAFWSLFIGFYVWMSGNPKRRRQNLNRLAEQLRLEAPEISDLECVGVSRGRRVRFTEFTTGSGKTRTSWTDVAAAVQADDFRFILRPESLGSKLLEHIGVHEIKVGDVAFDERWHIKANNAELLRTLLFDELRAKINRAADSCAHGEYRIEDGWVLFRMNGSFCDVWITQQMESHFPIICDLADAVDVVAENGGRP